MELLQQITALLEAKFQGARKDVIQTLAGVIALQVEDEKGAKDIVDRMTILRHFASFFLFENSQKKKTLYIAALLLFFFFSLFMSCLPLPPSAPAPHPLTHRSYALCIALL